MHENLSDAAGKLVTELSPAVVNNALTEGRVLHARQLCEIFLSRSTENDNVRLIHLVSESDQSQQLKKLVAELDEKYGNRRTEGSPCWVFNKMLIHPTTERSDGDDYQSALDAVKPILKLIVREIELKRGQFE
jgi:hypothetical protein